MKTTGVSCVPKFRLLFFFGTPYWGAPNEEKDPGQNSRPKTRMENHPWNQTEEAHWWHWRLYPCCNPRFCGLSSCRGLPVQQHGAKSWYMDQGWGQSTEGGWEVLPCLVCWGKQGGKRRNLKERPVDAFWCLDWFVPSGEPLRRCQKADRFELLRYRCLETYLCKAVGFLKLNSHHILWWNVIFCFVGKGKSLESESVSGMNGSLYPSNDLWNQ